LINACNRRPFRKDDDTLQRQNERLQLLLKLTNSITSNLELKEVMRAIAASVREVMHCDAASISLPGAELGTFRLYAVDFPSSKGFVKEEQIITPGEHSPAKRAFDTLKPVIASTGDGPPERHGYKMAAAEGLKTACFIPLVNRGRAVGTLQLARATGDTFTQEDLEFLSQAAGQIAIAIENALGIPGDFRTQGQVGPGEALSRRRNPQRDEF